MNNMEMITVNERSNIWKKIKMKREYLEELSNALGDNRFEQIHTLRVLLKGDENPVVVNAGDFLDFATQLLYRGESTTIYGAADQSSEVFKNEYYRAYNAFTEIRGTITEKDVYPESAREDFCKSIWDDCLEKESMDDYEKFFTAITDLLKIDKKIYKRRDLIKAKDSIAKSLSYICTTEQLTSYEERCNELFNQEDIDLKETEKFLKDVQLLILEDWKTVTTSIADFVPGEPFRFICHSTSSRKFTDDFRSRYVSTSLLTEEFTETYHSGCGFIFEPNNIVGASGKDMYAINIADNEGGLINSSSLPPISSLAEIIDSCRAQREENQKDNKNNKIYSEVVIDGFNPSSIFCITDGSMQLNENYKHALEIKKYFPQLKIIEIDLTLYKEYSELTNCRDTLIKSIEREIDPEYYKKPDINCDLYELFWQKYLSLKKQKDYKESDIIDLYRENKEILGFAMDIEKLFSGKYDPFTIRYTLLKNPKFNIEAILNGNFDKWNLMGLKRELENCASNDLLNRIFSNIGIFINLLNQVNITDELVTIFKGTKPVTFTSMIGILGQNLHNRKNELTANKNQMISDKDSLEIAINKREIKYQRNNRYRGIIDNEYFYTIAMSDRDFETSKIDCISIEEQEIEYKKAGLETELSQKQKLKEGYSKHRFLNYFKLRGINMDIKELENRIAAIVGILDEKGSQKKTIQKIITELDLRFKETFGYDIYEYSALLDEANSNFIYGFDTIHDFEISTLRMKLSAIEEKLLEIKLEERNLDDNIELIEPIRKVG